MMIFSERSRLVARSIFFMAATSLFFALGARLIFFGFPPSITALISNREQAAAAASVMSPFLYEFRVDGTLEESGASDESTSPYWWLDSGGRLVLEDGRGKTLSGSLPALDRWRVRYALSSAGDTANGAQPQNLFRLLTRSDWENVRAEMSFRIRADNFLDSPNRNESNGLFLMSRYEDGDNLYYAGIRVDGTAVIKKKYKGAYYTLAQEKVFDGNYSRGAQVNLLPHDEWITLRSETETISEMAVTIKLFLKREDADDWQLLISATDRGDNDSTPPISGAHPLGIRTDFMEVEFDDFRAENI